MGCFHQQPTTLYSTLCERLNKPYPQPFAPALAMRKAAIAGVFVALVNTVFEPFGLAGFTHPHKPWVLIGFGVPVSLFWPIITSGLPSRTAEQPKRPPNLKCCSARVTTGCVTTFRLLRPFCGCKTNTVTDAKAIEALRASEKRLESIAVLHEKLYQNENVTQVDLCAYLEELTYIIARH